MIKSAFTVKKRLTYLPPAHIVWGGTKVPKFYQELSLMSSTIAQNFKKFGSQVFPKNWFKFQKNQNFADKFFLNTIPRPKFVTNDNNFLLDN